MTRLFFALVVPLLRFRLQGSEFKVVSSYIRGVQCGFLAPARCFFCLFLFLLLAIPCHAVLPPIRTVFVIVLENESWSSVKDSPSAPYINNTLLPMASRCEGYLNVPNIHPSLPNYLWLEAGTNFGIFDDNDPSIDHQNTTNHLTTLLKSAGISWKAYQEDIQGDTVPLNYTGYYAPRHDPFVYFDDVTGTNNPNYPYGIAHIRPFTEFAADLTNNAVARYNFITPNVCNDGHDSCPPLYDGVRQADTWISVQIPKILNSQAYQEGGVIFLTWDECVGPDSHIGMIVLSPFARGGGYYNTNYYTHSSLVRTLQEIFSVGPFLDDAANADDLSDLFNLNGPKLTASRLPDGSLQLVASGTVIGTTNCIQASSDLSSWTNIGTNVPNSAGFIQVDSDAPNFPCRFYRLLQLP
jgi:phospholipase C